MNAVQISWDTMSASSTQAAKTFYTQVREETAAYGIENAGIKELLALIIGPKADIKLCQELACLQPNRLMAMGVRELVELGASHTTAVRMEAIFWLTRKLQSENRGATLNTPREAVEALAFIVNEEQEHFVVLLLDIKNHLKKTVVVTKGTSNSSLVHPREVFKLAIRESAQQIIVGHNHPSGDPTPSEEDIAVTKKLSKAGETLGIALLDSIIVGSNGYRSLKEEGIV